MPTTPPPGQSVSVGEYALSSSAKTPRNESCGTNLEVT
jgi:hypothetical protein